MQSASGGKFTAQKVQGFYPRQTGIRLAIIFALLILYTLTFPLLTEKAGQVGAALVAIPVAMTGWYFGTRAGLLAGLLGITLSTLLFAKSDGYDWFTSILISWPGNLVVLVVGYVAGRLQSESAERIQMMDELRSRERYLSLINITTKDILNPKNPKDRYYYLIIHLANIFIADHAHLIRWDAIREQATLVASTISLEKSFSESILDPSESSLTESVLQTGHALILDEVSSLDHVINPAFLKLPPSQSVLCLPLIARDYKFGVVIIAFNDPRRFTPEELRYAELAANQIALVLWSVEQELEIQKRLKEANALAKIEHLLSETERVGLGTVLELIINSAKELIPGAEYAVLHLLDNEREILVPRAVAGFKKETTSQLSMRPGEGIAGQVISTGEVIAVADTRKDDRFLNQAVPVKFRSLIVAPIQSNERRVGTISVQSKRPNAFTPDESRLLGALGTEAAIAIENADLLETTRQNLKEINALYHISQGLAVSLDTDQLIKDVADLLQQNFGYYHVQIFIVDPESGDLVARHGSGQIGDQLREQAYHMAVGSGIVGHVAHTGKPFVTNDVDNVIFFIRNRLLPDTQSELTVPIKVENQVMGVLDIQQVPPDRLTPRHLQLMTAIADQLAVALQKAKLYTELQASLHQEKTTRSQLIQSERLAVVGRLLASVAHELNNPLQAIQNALFLIKEEEKLSAQGYQDLEIVLSETERMAVLIERLHATYRPTRTENFQDLQINNIIQDVYALIATHTRQKEITFEFLPDPELPTVSGIPDQIRQVVLNLFLNAMEAMQMGGHITMRTEQIPEQDSILLSVTDNGPGIDAEILPHIFEPFITSKETGTGLGLTIIYDIVRQHKGEIQAENNPQGGAVFKVWLPIKKKD
jgi:signal transduction histidine kinase